MSSNQPAAAGAGGAVGAGRGGIFNLARSPVALVWGKFMACSLYCLIYIVATVPLLALSLLFAGVSFQEIVIAYVMLIGLTLLLSMTGVFISSCFSSNLRATLTCYVVSL